MLEKSKGSDILNQDEDELLLRPQKLSEYIGQKNTKEVLDVYVNATLKRGESLDHVLLYGPPGLGKTTLAVCVANELGVNIKTISAPALDRVGDLVGILTSLKAGDVLFIDEIHRLSRQVEETLYSAMEDYHIDIIIDKDKDSRTIRIDLPPFTLIGATTRFGDLSAPLRERFGVVLRLIYYTQEELELIVERTARVFDTTIDKNAIVELAKRSRGTPRLAIRLFKRVRDFAEILNNGFLSHDIAKHALVKLGIDKNGLDASDYNYLRCLIEKLNGGPVGVETIATTIGEEVITIVDVYEPYLLQEGFIKRTTRGRIATPLAYKALGIKEKQEGLFNED